MSTDNTSDSRAEFTITEEMLQRALHAYHCYDEAMYCPSRIPMHAALEAGLREQLAESQREVAALTKDAERHEHALQQIQNWCNAYPLSVFPEPDFPRAAKVLKDAGMTIDSISASNMRHVINGVSKIVDAALRSEGERVSGAEGSK